jgi:hypothetical protein
MRLAKGDPVIELGDETHIGTYCGRRSKGKCLVRWAPNKTSWVRRNQLRVASEQEVVSYNYLMSKDIKSADATPRDNEAQLRAYNAAAVQLTLEQYASAL